MTRRLPPFEPWLANSFADYRHTMLPPDASDDVVATCQHAWAFGMTIGIGIALRALSPTPGPVDPYDRRRSDLEDGMGACIAFAGPSPAEKA